MSIKEKQLVQSFLKQLPVDTVIKQIKRLTVNGQYGDVEELRIFKATKPLQSSHALLHSNLQKKLDSLEEDVNNIKNEIQSLIDSLQPQYQVCDQLIKVEGVEKVSLNQDGSFKKENSEFQVEQQIIYLLIVWDASKQYCQARIDKYQNMLANPLWEGKVKMVCISINDDIELVIETLKQKNWKSIQHYRFLKGWDKENSLIKYSQMKGTPFVMLINKEGIIDYLGYYPKENFEERINELIEVKEDQGIQQFQQIQEQIDAPKPQELLTIEEYQELKSQWKTLQTALEQAKFKGKITVTFEKVNFLKQDGFKVAQKRVKFILNYKVKVNEQSKIISFLEKYWKNIPENFRFIEKSKIIDPAKGNLDIKKKFQEVFQNLGVNITYIPYYNIILEYDSKQIILNKSEKFYVKVDNLTIEKYQIGYKIMEDDIEYIYHADEMNSTDNLNQLTKNLQNFVSLRVGQQFQAIPNYKKLGSNEFTNVEHIPGEILVIHYWFNQKYSSEELQNQLEEIKLILEKWGKTIRFVYLNYAPDEELEETMKQLQEYSDYIDFYFPKYKGQSDIILYKICFKNNYTIIDENGIIRKMGKTYNIYEQIEKLKHDQDLSQSSDEDESVDILSQDIVDKVLVLLQSAEVQQKLNQVDKEQIIQFTLFFEQTPVKGQLKFKIPRLYVVCRDYQWEVVNQILEKIFELIPEENFNFSKKIHKTFSVPYPGSICFLCNKDILNEPQQYYSPFKKEYLCVECAEFEDKSKQGSERYKCTDNLIFINGPLTDLSVLQNIDVYMIGKNLQLQEGEKASQWHQIFCMGCKKGLDGPRYIATSCKSGRYGGEGYVDFCQNCFILLRDKKSEEAQTIITKNVKVGMIEDSLLVRILFYHGDEKKF